MTKILKQVIKEVSKIVWLWPWELSKLFKSKISCLMILAPYIAKSSNQMWYMVRNFFIVLTDMKTSIFLPEKADYKKVGGITKRFLPILDMDGADVVMIDTLSDYFDYYMLADDLRDMEEDRKKGKYNPFNEDFHGSKSKLESLKSKLNNQRINRFLKEQIFGFWW